MAHLTVADVRPRFWIHVSPTQLREKSDHRPHPAVLALKRQLTGSRRRNRNDRLESGCCQRTSDRNSNFANFQSDC